MISNSWSLTHRGFPPILLGIKERKRKEKKSKRKKRCGLVSTASTGHPLDSNVINLDKWCINVLYTVNSILLFFSRAGARDFFWFETLSAVESCSHQNISFLSSILALRCWILGLMLFNIIFVVSNNFAFSSPLWNLQRGQQGRGMGKSRGGIATTRLSSPWVQLLWAELSPI